MEKFYYRSIDEFKNAIKPCKIIDCNEGYLYLTDSCAYKVLDIVRFSCSPKLLKKLNKLEQRLLTIPKSLLYFLDLYEKHNVCAGFAMENSGQDLWSLLLNDVLSFKEKKEIALQMKEICSYLKKKRYVHGDIKLENFLYKDGILRLTDINNMRKNPNIRDYDDKLRMPKLYEMQYLGCEDGFYVDYLAINYCMYILLNFDLDGIIKIIRAYDEGFHYDYEEILDSENKVFDSEIHKKMKYTFEHIEERKLTKEFLVDYLI